MPQPDAADAPVVALIRPQAAAERFAALLRQARPDLPILIAPLMRIVPVAHDSARLHAAPGVVLTSAEAVSAAGPGHGRLAICVGEATADAARAAGFRVQQGEGDAASLEPLIAAAGTPLIHPHGLHVARVLPVPGIVVYDQQALPPPAALLDLLAGPRRVILPLFSARSTHLAAEVVGPARVRAVAISPAVAEVWGVPVATARRADAAAMRDAVLQDWAALTSEEQRPRKPG